MIKRKLKSLIGQRFGQDYRAARKSARRSRLRIECLEQRINMSAAHDLIGVTQLRNDPRFAGIDGSGVSVVVIDTGVDVTHPLISPNYVKNSSGVPVGFNFLTGGNNPLPLDEHGTHVAGIIGASDPKIGVAPRAGLIGLQVFNPPAPGEDQPLAPVSNTERALQWVLENHQAYNIVAVNMSLGGGYFKSPAEAAGDPRADEIKLLERAGVAVVSAAGNSYDEIAHRQRIVDKNQSLNFVGSPGILSTFNVGAVYESNDEQPLYGYAFLQDTDQDGWIDEFIRTRDLDPDRDQITFFSQRPSNQLQSTIFAPGAEILSTVPGNGLEDLYGTSMATPMVAGVVALLQELAIELSGSRLPVTMLRQVINEAADLITDNAADTVFESNLTGDPAKGLGTQPLNLTGQTYRRINAFKAAERLLSMFSGNNDTNGTIQTASMGREVFTVLGTATTVPRNLESRKKESERPIIAKLGTDGDRNLGGRDVDMYRVDVLSAGELSIWTYDTTPSNTTDNPDTYLRLFTESGTVVAQNDNSTGKYSLIKTIVPAGIYYVGVSGAPNSSYDPNRLGAGVAGSTGEYALRFALAAADTDATLETSNDLGVIGETTMTITEAIGWNPTNTYPERKDAIDIYRVVIQESGVFSIDIDPWTDSYTTNLYKGRYYEDRSVNDPNQDTYLRLFDVHGNEVASNDDGLANANLTQPREVIGAEYDQFVFLEGTEPPNLDNSRGRGSARSHGRLGDSYLSQYLEPGVYYIGISKYGQQNYDPNSTAGRSEVDLVIQYELRLEHYPNDQDGTIARAASVSDHVLSLNGTLSFGDEIGYDDWDPVTDDVDMWQITPTSNGLLEVAVTAFGDPRIVDMGAAHTGLSIWDANGNRLAAKLDLSLAVDPRIQISVSAGVPYYVAVSGLGNTDYDPKTPYGRNSSAVGYYDIDMTLKPANALALLANDTTSSPRVTEIKMGQLINESIGTDRDVILGASDVDLYRFVPTRSQRISIETDATRAHNADTVLRLFRVVNGQAVEVAQNDNASSTRRSSRIDYSVTAGETYFIGVSGATGTSATYNPVSGGNTKAGDMGLYALSIIEIPPTMVSIRAAAGSSSVAEGSSGTKELRFEAVRSGDTAAAFTVDYALGPNGTAGVNASDFINSTLPSGRVSFAAGETVKTISVLIQGDEFVETNEGLAITLSAATNGVIIETGTASATILNDDNAGLRLSQSLLSVSETGTSGVFTVALTGRPASPVTVGLTLNDATEASLSTNSLTFNSSNWNVPQSVTVRGVDDFLVDGSIASQVIVAVIDNASDDFFDPVGDSAVAVNTLDNDVAGLQISPSNLVLDEGGNAASILVRLTSQPTSNVIVNLTPSHTTEATVMINQLTFTPTNWSVAQSVVVSPVDDSSTDGDIQSRIVIRPDGVASDATYRNLAESVVMVTTRDNDKPGFLLDKTALSVTEAGATDTVYVRLTSRPTSQVVIRASTNLASQMSTSVTDVTFTPSDWNTPKPVVVSAVDDQVADGTAIASLNFDVVDAMSDDTFDPIPTIQATVSIQDNESVGMVLSKRELVVRESGQTDSFTVALRSRPLSPVVLRLTSGDDQQVTVSPSVLRFEPHLWSVGQTVTVRGFEDYRVDGPASTAIRIAVVDAESNDLFDPIADEFASVTSIDDGLDGVPFSALYDFGTRTSPVATGAIGVSEATKVATAGYGWTTTGMRSVDRRTANAETRDLMYGKAGRFVANVPNGTYQVDVALGDTANVIRDQVGIWIEGLPADLVTTAGRQIAVRSYTCEVKDNQFTIDFQDFGGTTSEFTIASLRLTRINADIVAPMASIQPLTGGLSGEVAADSAVFDVRFTEPVFGLTAQDFVIELPNHSTAPTIRLDGMGSEYRLSIVEMIGQGNIRVSLPAGRAEDLSGNSNLAVPAQSLAYRFQRQFDFGTSTSAVESNHVGVNEGSKYSASSGFGWVSGQVTSVDRRTGSARDRDLNLTQNATFAVNLPNGVYDVTVRLGDLGNVTHDSVAFDLEATRRMGGNTAPRQLSDHKHRVEVRDGQLTLRLYDEGGRDRSIAIASLTITYVGSLSDAVPTATNKQTAAWQFAHDAYFASLE
jgi:fibronectin type 3 domain-containing protein